LSWVNRAYAAAVEAQTTQDAISEGRELFGTSAREMIAGAHLSSRAFNQDLSTVIGGDRRILAVSDYAGKIGSAGMAMDVSEIASVREEYERMVRSHAE